MKKHLLFLVTILALNSCQNFGQLTLVADLPKSLKEVSGNEFVKGTKSIWMHNDSGNAPKIYRFSKEGKLLQEIYIKAKNNDWEDITSDKQGNLYLGDFGNNKNKRQNLKILKIDKKYFTKKKAEVEIINFEYENQKNFPPKKEKLLFDAEAFFYHKNYFYVFTKSRVKNEHGKTSLYKIPAQKGKHIAKLHGEFDNGKIINSWITSADISDDGKKVVLLSQKNILIFTDFKNDNFLSGNVKKIALEHKSQKEGICFKDNKTLYITDEKTFAEGRNLYELKIDEFYEQQPPTNN